MLKIKIYKYDSTQESNGYRGTDYSAYVLQGFQDTEDITQELDTSEITLCGLTQAKEFDPETKFIIDFVKIDAVGDEIIQNTLHRVVARDMVSQPILSDDTYYDHHISLIEPSVIAQKRLVDNISATYKLKDVSLEQVPAYPDTKISYGFASSEFVPQRNFLQSLSIGFNRSSYNLDFGKYFKLDGDLVITNSSGEIKNIYNNIEDFRNQDNTYTANFQIPRLEIYVGDANASTFTMVGHASLHYRISEYDINDPNNPTVIREDDIISNDNLGVGTSLSSEAWQSTINGEWLYEGYNIIDLDYYGGNGHPEYRYKKYTNRSASTPNYTISNVPIQVDKQYVLEVSLCQFTDNLPSFQYSARSVKYTGSQPCYYSSLSANYQNTTPLKQTTTRQVSSFLTNENTTGTTEIKTYSSSSATIVYASSTPYSALALLQKAILNTSLYQKKDGVYIADVNKNDLPFVIDTNYVDKLSATRVIENFYSQKNLWEIMIEVGHYIHAIPELRFGADDKFEITFNELGRTDQHIDSATKVSIYNSRSVEDYISATSSYVSNMVQLGGYIQEWVVPKTTDDTLLIANDTANIMTTKPIIELLEVQVRSNINQIIGGLTLTAGQTVDLTPYIYEENVYKTLSIKYDDKPNRGIAMYYRLGSNEITGGQYRLPRPSYDIYNDYAFKKVIYCAFNGGYEAYSPTPISGYWTDLKVNNFSFLVKYRTKDEVRQNHARPDLRKYLLNSKYDRYPEHNQFNNQQDILVDSIKFGNNVYGKLIKTGNSEYTKQEWVDDYDNVKHKGELYNIGGSLYYVAQITNTYYADHIVSEVKFSKDYNELSAVIGIPSEPRFYEISEQSQIRREVAINDLLLVTDDWSGKIDITSGYVFKANHLKDIIFGTGTGTFAKYALTVFKGDKDANKYDQTVGQPNLIKEIFTPINAYSSENTLTYEWDMLDNYSAGDKVISTDQTSYSADATGGVVGAVNNGVYNSLWAVPYTDIYGRASLMDFYILGDVGDLTTDEIKALPESPITTLGKYIAEMQTTSIPDEQDIIDFYYDLTGLSEGDLGDIIKVVVTQNGETSYYKYTFIEVYDEEFGWEGHWVGEEIPSTWTAPTGTFLGERDIARQLVIGSQFGYFTDYNSKGLSLLKDNREALSINYNLELVTNSDTFVLSPFVFLPDKKDVSIVLLSEEVNKLTDGYLDISKIITAKDANGDDILDSNGDPYFHWTGSQLAMLSNLLHGNGWNWSIYETSAFQLVLDQILANVNSKHFEEQDDPSYQRVKAIAVICNVNQNPSTDTSGASNIIGKTQFVLARNIPDTFTKAQAIQRWTFGLPNKNLFTNKQ